MKAEFSEFTYGFSIVSELSNALGCSAVPIFPSLIQEGKDGGYDVKLDAGGIPFYLQFKLSNYMKSQGAKEIKSNPGILHSPYFRFPITSSATSKQHSLLVGLSRTNPHTYYCAPQFHTMEELNQCWLQCGTVDSSIFVSPKEIGSVLDKKTHTVCFDQSSLKKGHCYFFSEPKEIALRSLKDLSDTFAVELADVKISVRDAIPDWLERLEEGVRIGLNIEQEKERILFDESTEGVDARVMEIRGDAFSDLVESVILSTHRSPTFLEEADYGLYRMAQLASRVFGSQLFLLQRRH